MKEWISLLGSDKGLHEGAPHLRSVEQNTDKTIPDSIKNGFETGEIFLLLCSIFLSASGRIVSAKRRHLHNRRIISER